MASRTVEVKILADVSKLQKGFKAAGRDADSFGKKVSRGVGGGLGKLKLAAAGAGVAVGGALVVGLKSSIDAAIEAEKAQANLRNALSRVGADTPKVVGQVDSLVTSLSNVSGFDDEDLTNAFADLARTTGSAKTAMQGMGLVADLARSKNISLAAAAKIVGRVQNGNTGILKRYGIELGKGATAQEALAAMQQKFGGAAAAYGRTTAGALDRAKVAVGNLQESIGQQLAPAVAWLATKGAEYVNKFGPVIAAKLGEAVAWVKANWPQIKATVKAVMAALRPIVIPILNQIKATFKLVGALIRGDWRAAWNAVKTIASNKVAEVRAVINLAASGIRAAAEKIGNAIKNKIREGAAAALTAVGNKIEAIPGAISAGLQAAKDAATELGEGVAQAIKDGVGDIGGWIAQKARDGLNSIIRAFNSLSIPRFSISTPSFSIPVPGLPDINVGSRSVGAGPFDLPDVPQLAKGGVVNRPTLAMIGEAGPEAVVPLGRGGGLGGVVIHVHGSVIHQDDLVELVRKGLQKTARRNVSVGF